MSKFYRRTSRDLLCASKAFVGVTAVKTASLSVGLRPIFTRAGCSCRIQLIVPTAMLHTASNLTIVWRVDTSSWAAEM